MLDTADNPLDLQRGREQARNARLDLERRRCNLYGQRQELFMTVQPLLNIAIVAPIVQSVPAVSQQSSDAVPIMEGEAQRIVSKD